jgi:endonuclease/exonuclease/phosphatase family metal-dependent hydrolase
MDGPAATSRLLRPALSLCCWGYFLLLIGLIVFLRTLGDRTSWATVLLFSPRWVWLTPLTLLLPLSARLNRRALVPLALSSGLGVFPLMGFCVGLRGILPAAPSSIPLRVMAFNVHHIAPANPDIQRFIAAERPDLIALEELPPHFDSRVFTRAGWNYSQKDELCVASRYPITSSRFIRDSAVAVFTAAIGGQDVEVIVVHLSSPHFALRDAVKAAPGGLDELSQNIGNRGFEAASLARLSAAASGPLIIAGDFNLCFDSPLYAGRLPTMTDAFSATGLGFGWTYYNNWIAVRIDRVLTNDRVQSRGFHIGPFLGSPHRPIVADLRLRSDH